MRDRCPATPKYRVTQTSHARTNKLGADGNFCRCHKNLPPSREHVRPQTCRCERDCSAEAKTRGKCAPGPACCAVCATFQVAYGVRSVLFAARTILWPPPADRGAWHLAVKVFSMARSRHEAGPCRPHMTGGASPAAGGSSWSACRLGRAKGRFFGGMSRIAPGRLEPPHVGGPGWAHRLHR